VLAKRYRQGELPEFGLTAFLAEYGHRGAAEIDVGVPRWAEDPTALFAALAGYLRVNDPETAPDVRFARAAADAEEGLDLLVGRAVRSRPLRAAVAGFLLRRSRALAGLRELPKFVWLHPLGEIRRQLLLAGKELADRGTINTADDIVFLTLAEAAEAAAGMDYRARAATRRTEYERETRRRRVPGLLLSDGTMPEALPDEETLGLGSDNDRLIGMPAAAGTATGTVRVVYDPTTARIEPGDILVAPTTDPGWTPLFLTVGGLITETGSTMAHGPTVAREYGIPAIICVPEATTRLITGQTVSIDGASGLIQVKATT
jgi:rifampicin phosphotransferase